MAEQTHLQPSEVHDVLARHVLTDGMKLVLDLRHSRGSRLVDARTGECYLDMYTFFASAPLGLNPPGIADDPTFMAELAEIAANKPAVTGQELAATKKPAAAGSAAGRAGGPPAGVPANAGKGGRPTTTPGKRPPMA